MKSLLRALAFLFVSIICCAEQSKVDALIEEAKGSPNQEELAKQILQLDSHCGDGYAIEGCGKYFHKDVPGAIKSFDTAVRLGPKDQYWLRTALNYRYHGYIQLQDWKNALTCCLQTLQYEHTPGVAHDAAVLCRKTGDFVNASKYDQLAVQYRKAPNINPTDSVIEIRRPFTSR